MNIHYKNNDIVCKMLFGVLLSYIVYAGGLIPVPKN